MSYRATVWTDKRRSRLFASVDEAVEWVKAETDDNRKRLIEFVNDPSTEDDQSWRQYQGHVSPMPPPPKEDR